MTTQALYAAIEQAPPVLPGFGQRITARATTRTGGLIIDNFAGAGGASRGIEAAMGRAVDICINHSELALRTHMANHPASKHLCGDIWDYKPLDVTGGRQVDLAWFSPDCKHFSKAKGGKPVSPRVRGLAWVVVRWAREVKPAVIMLENVEEFQDWGPLIKAKGTDGRELVGVDGRPVLMPDKTRRGETFRRWVEQLRKAGYTVEWRELIAADHGVPTIRRRLFLVARRDGQPIVWPRITHAPRQYLAWREKHGAKASSGKGFRAAWTRYVGVPNLRPWRTAAECIDFSLPCPSIFLTKEEAKRAGCKRPLAPATLRRVAHGIRRYVIDAAEPFIVQCNHGDSGGSRCRDLNDPMVTLTASRDAHGLVVPTIVSIANYGTPAAGVNAIDDPLTTITANPKGGHHALVSSTLIQTGYGEREGQAPRVPGLENPLGTVVSGACKHALVSAFLAKFRGDSPGNDANDPMSTITSGAGSKRPAGAAHAMGVVSASLVGCGGRAGQSAPRSPLDPAATITAKADTCIAAATLTKFYGTSAAGCDINDPSPTVTCDSGGGHMGLVEAFLVAYYGNSTKPRSVDEPSDTITTKHRLGLVAVSGCTYRICDIGLRMLTPRELLRAQFGRYAADYVLLGTQSQQVAGIGNSVPPEMAEALVRANVPAGRRKP